MWLHGFTQTSDSAHLFRSILAGSCELVVLDLPGHGVNSSVTASLDETADLLAPALGADPFVLAGYSFGARVALHFALRHQERLSGLVLLGASRGIEDEFERRARRRRDEALADRIELIGTEAFLEEWLAQPMFATLPRDPLERGARSVDPSGLANSLRRAGTGTQAWLEPRLSSIDVATLTLAGELDAKFRIEADAIAQSVANGQRLVVAGAQHAAHLERPEAVARAVLDFIDQR